MDFAGVTSVCERLFWYSRVRTSCQLYIIIIFIIIIIIITNSIILTKNYARYGPGRQSRQQSLVKLGQLQQVSLTTIVKLMMRMIIIFDDDYYHDDDDDDYDYQS